MLCLGVRKTGKLNFFANEILNLILLTPLDFPDVVLKKLPTKIKSVASLRFKIIGKADGMGLDLIFGVNDEAVEIEFNVHAFWLLLPDEQWKLFILLYIYQTI